MECSKIQFLDKALKKGTLQLPCPLEIPGTTNMLPFLFIEDEVFPLKNNLRPYPGVALSKDKAIFNYRQSRTRRCVENAFGIIASCFRIFRKPLVSIAWKVAHILSPQQFVFTITLKVQKKKYHSVREDIAPWIMLIMCNLMDV
ncbi:DDE Tnp4 domain-containing protein [Trichonephila clavipes]|nr:DDE Tnp4 domain-containing protein [Trichonephila clavipes]